MISNLSSGCTLQKQDKKLRSPLDETVDAKKPLRTALPGVDFKGGDLPGVGGLRVNSHEVCQVSMEPRGVFQMFEGDLLIWSYSNSQQVAQQDAIVGLGHSRKKRLDFEPEMC